jgi:hypothetical protein
MLPSEPSRCNGIPLSVPRCSISMFITRGFYTDNYDECSPEFGRRAMLSDCHTVAQASTTNSRYGNASRRFDCHSDCASPNCKQSGKRRAYEETVEKLCVS